MINFLSDNVRDALEAFIEGLNEELTNATAEFEFDWLKVVKFREETEFNCETLLRIILKRGDKYYGEDVEGFYTYCLDSKGEELFEIDDSGAIDVARKIVKDVDFTVLCMALDVERIGARVKPLPKLEDLDDDE